MDADVIIVGAGPAGLMLTAELRLAGARPRTRRRHPPRTGVVGVSQDDATVTAGVHGPARPSQAADRTSPGVPIALAAGLLHWDRGGSSAAPARLRARADQGTSQGFPRARGYQDQTRRHLGWPGGLL